MDWNLWNREPKWIFPLLKFPSQIFFLAMYGLRQLLMEIDWWHKTKKGSLMKIFPHELTCWASFREYLPCVSICVFVKENTKALLSLHDNKRIWLKEKEMSVENAFISKAEHLFISDNLIKKNSCRFYFVSMYVFHLHHLYPWMTTRVPCSS